MVDYYKRVQDKMAKMNARQLGLFLGKYFSEKHLRSIIEEMMVNDDLESNFKDQVGAENIWHVLKTIDTWTPTKK